jgi:hypothetical protein
VRYQIRSEISIDIDCGVIAIVNNSQQREEKIVCERAHKAGERPHTTHTHPPTARLAKPAGGWDEDFAVNNLTTLTQKKIILNIKFFIHIN